MADSEDLFFIDTNLLVYAYHKGEIKKHLISNKLLEKCWKREIKYFTSSQNLAEFLYVVTEKIEKPLELEDAKKIINDIINFSNWVVLSYNKKTILKAMDIKILNNMHFWDALLIATMLENNIFNIYTENEKDFIKVKNINAINPFK